MNGYTVVELWVMVDENGDYVVSKEREELALLHDNDIGGRDDGLATRMVRINVNVPTPKAVELMAVVGEEATGGELKAV